MKKFLFFVVTASFVLSGVGIPQTPTQADGDRPLYVPGELLISFRQGVPLPADGLSKASRFDLANQVLTELDQLLSVVAVERVTPVLPQPIDAKLSFKEVISKSGPESLEDIAALFSEYGLDRIRLVRVAQNVDVATLAEEIQWRYPDLVEFAEPNYLHKPDLRPNDPSFGSQWHLAKVQATSAWDVTTGDAHVVIAVIDTGISAHPDLTSKMFANPGEIPGNGLDDDNNDLIDDVSGWDFLEADNDPNEETLHGTWVSGVAAATTNNGRDIAGMAWDCTVLPVKACCTEDGYFSSSAEVRAINYATMMAVNGVRVINMSFGGLGRSGSVLRAVQAANAANILCVASSGNGGSDGRGDNNDVEQHYPSGFELDTDNMIGVAATNSSDRLSFYSNYGLSVGVAAPGDNILTTNPGSRSTARVSGTSFSAPLVSGIAALIYSRFPGISPLQVRGRLEGNVDEVSSLKGQIMSDGRVNAARVFEIDDIPPAPITDLQVEQGANGPVLTWTAPGDDGMEGRASFYDIRYLTAPITPANFRYTKRLINLIHPGAPGAKETLVLPDDFPVRGYVLIRVLDNVGNVTEADQIEVTQSS